MILCVHWLDFFIVMAYFEIILYLGVFHGGGRTKTLSDFFVMGGKWDPIILFIFIFTSAIAGNEAVEICGQTYENGLSRAWYWCSLLFAIPAYFLFSTYFKRARIYNISVFFEMRYDKYASALHSFVAVIICLLFIGMFLLAIAKILAGLTTFNQSQCVLLITLIGGTYGFSSGMMSTLLNNILQDLMYLINPILKKAMVNFLTPTTLPKLAWNPSSTRITEASFKLPGHAFSWLLLTG